MKKAILFCGLFFPVYVLAQTDTLPVFIQDSLDNYVNRALQIWNIPGAAVCIIKDGKVVMMKGYGVKEAGKPDKVDENTLFMIGSNTKSFTATALAMLEEDKPPAGRPAFSLDDKVQKWLPGFTLMARPTGEHAIIRDLLSHRMGLEDSQQDFINWTSNLTRKEVIEKMRYIKSVRPFRTGWNYSNAGYVAAGEIIPAATGMQWEDFVKKRIFVPLEMDHTLALSKDIFTASNKSTAHTIVNGQPIKVPYPAIDNLAAAGSMSSSVNDMSHWVMALLARGKYKGKQVVSENALDKTWFPHAIIRDRMNLFNSGHFFQYGLGWFMQEYNGYKMVGHSGGVNGFVSSVIMVPEKGLGIIVLTNSDRNALFNAFFWEVIDAWFGLPYRNYIKAYADQYNFIWEKEIREDKRLRDSAALNLPAPLPLRSYTGKYVNEAYGEMTIMTENNELRMKLSHHPHMFAKLESLGNNKFYTIFTDVHSGTTYAYFKVKEKKIVTVSIKVSDAKGFEEMEFIKKEIQ